MLKWFDGHLSSGGPRVGLVPAGQTAATGQAVWEVREDEPGQLFLSEYGRAIRPNSIRAMLRRLVERAGVPCANPHRFRHAFAIWATESEARGRDVQFLLGHPTPVMVRRYASSYNAEKAARAHANWNPRVDWRGGASS